MSQLPMAGVKILEVASHTFTPSAGAVLADWGASVIKVEHAVQGDPQRALKIGRITQSAGSFSPIMEHANRGKRSIGLTIDTPAGLEVLYDLARDADVFLTNFLPDARARLKIDPEHLRAVNPRIIYVRGSALGAQGPEARNGGFDSSAFWGRAGSAAGVTPPDAGCLIGMPGPAFGDSLGGMTIASGISAALFARARTGEPSIVDVSLLSVGLWATGLAADLSLLSGEPFPVPTLHELTTSSPPNPIAANFQTSDGRWITLTMLQASRYWADFCRHLGRPELADDERFRDSDSLRENAPIATEIIRSEIRSRPLSFWREQLASLEGQWAVVQNSWEVGQDPQVRANGWIAEVTDAEGNSRELVTNPVQFDETPAALRRAPLFAEQTDEILAELGRDEDQILQLKIDSVVY
jgi:crotonobetainyl-CoA:carnitine CoA-transferase CaiB-like acyl-CoA transferase